MIRSLTLGIALSAIVAVGCGGTTSGTAKPAEPAQDPDDLRGNTFFSAAVYEDERPRELVDGTHIRLRFERREDGDVVSWSAGCNSAGGDLLIDDTTLTIDRVFSTTQGCPAELERQDVWLFEFFDSDPAWRLEDDRLSLTSGADSIVLERDGAEAGGRAG